MFIVNDNYLIARYCWIVVFASFDIPVNIPMFCSVYSDIVKLCNLASVPDQLASLVLSTLHFDCFFFNMYILDSSSSDF